MELFSYDFFIITILFFSVAIVYSSVGHAGASGYSAVMALMSVQPLMMKTTSLMLNIAVGVIGFYRFYQAGLIDLKKVWPFIILSMPVAFFASKLTIDKRIFFFLLAIMLLISGVKYFIQKPTSSLDAFYFRDNEIPKPAAIVSGGVIGFLSGITGTGGAIFFTPLLLSAGWAKPREAAGLSVCFVLANSIFALAGITNVGAFIDVKLSLIWILTVVLGALVGTYLGIVKFSGSNIKKVLGIVLVIASIKLFALSLK